MLFGEEAHNERHEARAIFLAFCCSAARPSTVAHFWFRSALIHAGHETLLYLENRAYSLATSNRLLTLTHAHGGKLTLLS
jgi:hypothetical protein